MNQSKAQTKVSELPFGIRVNDCSLEFDFQFYMSDASPISSEMFSECLKGMNTLLSDSKRAFFSFLDIPMETKVIRNSVLIDEIRSGSKIEDFVFQIVFGRKEEAENLAERIRTYFAEHRKATTAAIILLILAFAAKQCITTFVGAEKSAAAFQAFNLVAINIGKDMDRTGDDVTKILENGISTNARTSKAAAQILLQAKRKGATCVKLGGSHGIELPQNIVTDIPYPDQIQVQPEIFEEKYDAVKVDFAAMDRDRQNHGWAVVLPEGYPGAGKRLRARLSDDVNPTRLMYANNVVVDITIMKSAKGKAKTVLIRAIHEETN